MQPIEAIIFDKDGTLFDFQSTWAPPFQRFLQRLAPGDMRMRAAEVLGYDLDAVRFRPESVVVAATTGEIAAALAPVLACTEVEAVAHLDKAGSEAIQVPAVPLRSCLQTLSERYVLGLVTNDSVAPAKAHLAQEGVSDMFQFIAGYDSGFGGKPAPGQIFAFAETTGVAPEATVMVGDSRHDLLAGRAAGTGTVGVLTGVADSADLADLADVILPDIGHLADWLDAR